MFIDVTKDSSANITFNDMAKVSIRGDKSYNVLWYYNNELVHEFYLNSGTWAGIPMNGIGDWVIEFWDEGNLINTYHNTVNNKDILIIFNNGDNELGEFVKRVKNYSNELISRLNINLYVFFKGSELCDFTDTRIKPLRLNDKIDNFNMIYSKTL